MLTPAPPSPLDTAKPARKAPPLTPPLTPSSSFGADSSDDDAASSDPSAPPTPLWPVNGAARARVDSGASTDFAPALGKDAETPSAEFGLGLLDLDLAAPALSRFLKVRAFVGFAPAFSHAPQISKIASGVPVDVIKHMLAEPGVIKGVCARHQALGLVFVAFFDIRDAAQVHRRLRAPAHPTGLAPAPGATRVEVGYVDAEEMLRVRGAPPAGAPAGWLFVLVHRSGAYTCLFAVCRRCSVRCQHAGPDHRLRPRYKAPGRARTSGGARPHR
jgi:hypothetical protein